MHNESLYLSTEMNSNIQLDNLQFNKNVLYMLKIFSYNRNKYYPMIYLEEETKKFCKNNITSTEEISFNNPNLVFIS